MSKTLKNLFITLLALLTIIVGSLAFAVPQTAKADNVTQPDFDFCTPYLDISETGKDISPVIPIRLNKSAADGYNGTNQAALRIGGGNGWLCAYKHYTQQQFAIGVYYDKDDATSILVGTYYIVSFSDFTYIYYVKESTVSGVTLDFNTPYVNSKLETVNYDRSKIDGMNNNIASRSFFQNLTPIYTYKSKTGKFGFPLENKTVILPNGNSYTGSFLFCKLVNVSNSSNYHLEFLGKTGIDCNQNVFGTEFETLIVKPHMEDIFYVPYKSESVCANEMLETLKADDGFLGITDDTVKDNLQNILDEQTVQQVTITYLENIPNTPFATAKSGTFKVRSVSEKIGIEDVFENSNFSQENRICGNSYISHFEKNDTDGSYVARYHNSIYLSGKTASGKNCDYFLSINNSYYDYFHGSPERNIYLVDKEESKNAHGLVTDGVMTVNLYSFLFNSIKQKYAPKLDNFTEKTLYGYFGFVAIPQAYELDNLWKDMFNKQTTFSGSLEYFKKEENLTIGQYTSLMDKYNYGWLSIAWSGTAALITGEAPANFYFFYADWTKPGDLFIGENGAESVDDNSGTVKKSFDNFLENVFGGNSAIITAIKVVALILVAILIFYVVYKLFLQNRNKNQRR